MSLVRKLIRVLAGFLILGSPACAQPYPQRSIRILEPLAAGSAVDVVTRIVAEGMGKILGQNLYVDNQPAAAGLTGMRSGARATPDGYTILAVNDSVITVLPNIRSDAGYDPRKDFEPIVQMVRIHWALVASPSLGTKTLAGFIAAAKSKPGVINFASGGVGSPQHIAMELLMRSADIELKHIPFRGVTPALSEAVADRIPVMFAAFPTPVPFVQTGQLTILGIADKKRLASLPNTPTLDEAGLPGFEFIAWGALVAPRGTPAPVIEKLNSAAVTALNDPQVHQRLVELGYEVVGGSPDDLKKLIAEDFDRKSEVLSAANIRAE